MHSHVHDAAQTASLKACLSALAMDQARQKRKTGAHSRGQKPKPAQQGYRVPVPTLIIGGDELLLLLAATATPAIAPRPTKPPTMRLDDEAATAAPAPTPVTEPPAPTPTVPIGAGVGAGAGGTTFQPPVGAALPNCAITDAHAMDRTTAITLFFILDSALLDENL